MTLIFSSAAYFCEGYVSKKLQLDMVLGMILIKKDKISLVKQSNISLTELGNSIDNYQEIYQIPYEKINKVYSLYKKRTTIIKIETRDNYDFSIILAKQTDFGKQRSAELIDLINASIINYGDVDKVVICQSCNTKVEANSTFCTNCGEKLKLSAIFCKNCNFKNEPNAKVCENCGTKLI